MTTKLSEENNYNIYKFFRCAPGSFDLRKNKRKEERKLIFLIDLKDNLKKNIIRRK